MKEPSYAKTDAPAPKAEASAPKTDAPAPPPPKKKAASSSSAPAINPVSAETLLQMPANGWPALDPADPQPSAEDEAGNEVNPDAPPPVDCRQRGWHEDRGCDTDKDSRGLTGKRPGVCSDCGVSFTADEKPALDVFWLVRLWHSQGQIDEAGATAILAAWQPLYEAIYTAKATEAARKAEAKAAEEAAAAAEKSSEKKAA